MSRNHPLASFHCEQSLGNSCFAACITILRLRTRTITPQDAAAHERDVFARLADRKAISYRAVGTELGVQAMIADYDQPSAIELIKGDIASQREWHITVMFSAPIREMYARSSPPPLSRHGDLPGDLGDRHAIVVAAVDSQGFLVLDPWLPATAQPRHIGFIDFVHASTGVYFPVRLP